MRSAEMIVHFESDQKEPQHFLYRGVRCHQPRAVFTALDVLLGEMQVFDFLTCAGMPRMVIEIGTTFGAFTAMLADHDLSAEAEFHSYDINDYGGYRSPRVMYHRADVFTQTAYEMIVQSIKNPGRALLFCDGGDKAREIRTYAPHMKKGDVILGHDYARVPEEHAPGWGYEFTYEQVKPTLETHGFEPFIAERMQRAAWGCWLKVR